MNDLVNIIDLKPELIFVDGGIDPVLDQIRASVKELNLDITTAAGRKDLKSAAHKVARSKTALNEMAKNHMKPLKEQLAAFDSHRKNMETKFDALRDEIKGPVTEYEDREKERVHGHKQRIAAMERLQEFTPRIKIELIKQRQAEVIALHVGYDWQEFSGMASKVYDDVTFILQRKKEELEDQAERDAELEKVRKEKDKMAEELAQLRKEKAGREAMDARYKAQAEADKKKQGLEKYWEEKAKDVKQSSEKLVALSAQVQPQNKNTIPDLEPPRNDVQVETTSESLPQVTKEVPIAKNLEPITMETITADIYECVYKIVEDEPTSCLLVDAILDGAIPHVTLKETE